MEIHVSKSIDLSDESALTKRSDPQLKIYTDAAGNVRAVFAASTVVAVMNAFDRDLHEEVLNIANSMASFLATTIGGGPFPWAADVSQNPPGSNAVTVGVGFIATSAATALTIRDGIARWAAQRRNLNVSTFIVGNALQAAVTPGATAVRPPGVSPVGPPPPSMMEREVGEGEEMVKR